MRNASIRLTRYLRRAARGAVLLAGVLQVCEMSAAELRDWRPVRAAGSAPLVLVIGPARLWPAVRQLAADSVVVATGATWSLCDPAGDGGREAVRRFSVLDQPQFVVLTATNEEVDRVIGLLPLADFREELARILAGRATLGALLAEAPRHPDDTGFQRTLGVKLAERGDDRAEPILRHVLRADAAVRGEVSRDAWWGLTTLARHRRRDAAVVAAAESVTSLSAGRVAVPPALWPVLARAYFRMGDSTRAVATWARAIAEAPTDRARWRQAAAMCRLWQAGHDSVRAWESRSRARPDGGR